MKDKKTEKTIDLNSIKIFIIDKEMYKKSQFMIKPTVNTLNISFTFIKKILDSFLQHLMLQAQHNIRNYVKK